MKYYKGQNNPNMIWVVSSDNKLDYYYTDTGMWWSDRFMKLSWAEANIALYGLKPITEEEMFLEVL